MGAVITCLLATVIQPKALTIPPDWELEALSCAAFDIPNTDGTTNESNLAPTIAPVVTQKGKQRMLHHPPTPQESIQPQPTAPSGPMPPPTPVPSPPRTRTRKQRDQGTPEPMFPSQETTTSADTALNQGEHQGPYPTIVQRIADLLRKTQELVKRQRGDSHLLKKKYKIWITEEPGGKGSRRRWTPLVCTPRFHPTPSHPPLPGARHPCIRPHHLWLPRSSTDYRADAKEVPLDTTQRRPRLRAFLRMSKAQEVHQLARRHVASPLHQALGSSRNGYPRQGSEI